MTKRRRQGWMLFLAGLLLLAKAALGMAETAREDGFHIHLDDLYSINAEEKSILIRKENGQNHDRKNLPQPRHK